MLHAVVRFQLPIVLICLLCSCIEVTLEPDAHSTSPPGWPLQDIHGPDTDPHTPSDSTEPPSDLVLTELAPPAEDTGPAWIACDSLCDCPTGNDCINKRCVEGTQPVFCCTHPECPTQSACWSAQGVPGICP